MLAEIRQLLERGGARRLSPVAPVWELRAPFPGLGAPWPFARRLRRFDALREELLAAALGLGGPTYLVTDGNPQAYGVGGPWAHAGERTWPVPGDCDVRDLLAGPLAEGDWRLYASMRALDAAQLPDAFAATPRDVADFALAHAVPLLAQAATGNDPWRVFVEEVRSQQSAAA